MKRLNTENFLEQYEVGNILTGNRVDYKNTVGITVYIPFSVTRERDNMVVMAKMRTLHTARPESGSWANTAAFRYNEFAPYVGSGGQYLVKIGQVHTYANQCSVWKMQQFYSYTGNDRLSFQCTGMVITPAISYGGTNGNKIDVDAIAGILISHQTESSLPVSWVELHPSLPYGSGGGSSHAR